MTAASLFWTLVARSTVGAVALNAAAHFLLFLSWGYLAGRVRTDGHFPDWLIWTTVVVYAVYACTMVWLGRRSFLRYQVADGTSSDIAGESMARVVPRMVADWMRCRPRGVVLNLVRREIYLLRPVWLLTLASLVGWAVLYLFHQFPKRGPDTTVPIAFVMTVMISPIIAVLAGTLSQGEEKTLGTCDWHMTVPLPLPTQWLVKLLVAILASFLCAGALPVLMLLLRGVMTGSPFGYLDHGDVWTWMVNVTAIALLAFWCSCVMNGTVRAALTVFPVLIVLGLSGQFGAWTAATLLPNMQLMERLATWLAPFRFTRSLTMYGLLKPWPMWYTPVALVILIQSFYLFRRGTEDTILHLLRRLLPSVVTTFFCSVALIASIQLLDIQSRQKVKAIRETHDAIVRLLATRTPDSSTVPAQYSVDQLAAASPLSDSTRRWLGNATVAVSLHPVGAVASTWPMISRVRPDPGMAPYTATLTLINGQRCQVSLEQQGFWRRLPATVGDWRQLPATAGDNSAGAFHGYAFVRGRCD